MKDGVDAEANSEGRRLEDGEVHGEAWGAERVRATKKHPVPLSSAFHTRFLSFWSDFHEIWA